MSVMVGWTKEGTLAQKLKTDTPPKSLEYLDWETLDDNFVGKLGDKRNWFDAENGMRKFTEAERVELGLQTDNRGIIYNMDDYSDTITINSLDVEVTEGYTNVAPLIDPETRQTEVHQKFDRAQDKWVVETEKKELAKKERELAQIKAQMKDREDKIIRPLRAIQGNRATELDITKYNELDAELEQVLRPELEKLEEEIAELEETIPVTE